MKRALPLFQIGALALTFVLSLDCNAANDEETRLGQLRCEWVGAYPDSPRGPRGARQFLALPELRKKMKVLLDRETYQDLMNLQGDKYLMDLIDFVNGYFVLKYTANLHTKNMHKKLYIVISNDLRRAHVAIVEPGVGNPTWRHYGEANAPRIIETMVSPD